MGDLGAIEEDVPFDNGVADALIAACDGAASVIEGQAGSRASWKNTALKDFRGHFSELFRGNASVASSDASELANRLREVATGARKLKEEARKEQERRQTARQWKKEQDDRNLLEKGGDFLFGGDDPPVGPPADEPTIPVSPAVNGTRQTPAPGTGGGGGGGTSSARPADLRTFASNSRGANDALRGKPGSLRTKFQDFGAKCRWGRMDASGVFTGFDKYLAANDEDVRWANLVANAFAAAGGEGNVSTVSNSALLSTLQAAGVDATRQDLVIDPPVAYGNPPTTGYANDPVNTSTGNFIENEADLSFPGATSALALARCYNSFNPASGAFGPGWSSLAEAALSIDDEAAHLTLPDGRQVVFPRLGAGWDRATGENLWLVHREGERGFRVSGNDGRHWDLAADGRLVSYGTGPGTTITLTRDPNGRLVRLAHERGRHIDLTWDTLTEDEAARVVEAVASDGRRVAYDYDDAGQLVAVTGPTGTRSYRWNDESLVEAVIDADGVVEAENTYDEQRRVVRQRSPFGRITRFVYLPGRVTVVSDEDGTGSNTWIADERGRLVGVVDAHEQRQSTSYDSHGNPVLLTERDGTATVHEYDDRGRRTRTVTPSGADLRFGFDEHDRVTTVACEDAVTTFGYADADDRSPCLVVDPEGGHTRLDWTNGLLTRVVDPTGVEVRFAHDAHGDLVATTDADGNTARLERDATGRVTAAVTPSGAVTTFTYSPAGHLESRTDPDGATWRYEHTTAGRLTTTTDPSGARTEVEHGSHGEPTRTIDALGRSDTRHYDDFGNLASVELPDGGTWRFAHDDLSRLTASIDPTGNTWTRDHDPVGHLTGEVDPTGVQQSLTVDTVRGRVSVADDLVTTGLQLDRLGRVIATQRPDGSSALTRYDRCGRPVEYVDESGAVTRLQRDAAGRVIELVRPSGATLRYDYDRCGRLVATTDPTGARTTYDYDVDGRLVREVHPDGDASTTEYDTAGRVVRHRRPGFGTSRAEYDAAGRIVATHDPEFGRRQFRYDAAGQLVAAVDGNGGVTRYDHDANGRVVAITDPLGAVTRRAYDACGRLVAQTDPLGRTTRAGYDAAGRQIWEEGPTGTRITWTYDASGRVLSLAADGAELRRIERDITGRRMRISEDGSVHELAWDSRGLLVERTRDGRGLRWEYDQDRRRQALVHPDGSRTLYEHDGAGRVTAVGHPLLGRAALTRDAAGRVTGIDAGDLVETWDHRDGFVTAHEARAAGTVSRTEVERNEDGRVVRIVRDGVATAYDYDLACQLIEARTGDTTTRWRYDACGRLVSENSDGTASELVYDAAGELLTARVGEAVTTYTHDAAGRRTRRIDADGTTHDYQWAPTGWLSGLRTSDAEGNTHERSVHVDALGELARVDDAELFWDTTDPWAPPVQVGGAPVVAAGPLTGVGSTWASPGWRGARSGTDPWRSASAVDAPGGIGVGAAGELLVEGLEWLRARVYDPSAHGFLSTDPLDPVAGAGWGGNPYSYAGNDPLHALDPLGLRPVTDAELQAYRDANNGAFAAVGDWAKDNWEYLAGGAMVIAGGVMMATGVGGPVGMALIAAGADTIIQKATTGEVNWGQVALSGGLGLVGGGAAAWATRASVNGTAALRTTMAVNAAVGATGSEAAYVIKNHDNLTWRGALAAGTGGALSGAIGGAAGPAGGTLATQLGQRSTGTLATTLTAGTNFAGGFGGNVVTSTVAGQPIDIRNAAISGAANAGGGYLGGRLAPGTGMTTLNQQSYFGPRTMSGAVNFSGPNSQAMWGSAGAGATVGFTADLSSP